MLAAFAAAALPLLTGAAEWFVATNGVDTADGTTAATALLSLQAAVDKASANDTIILLPGDHVAGTRTVESSVSRANVTKPLTIRSLGRAHRDTTRLVGAWDATATAPVGMGPNAIRCLRIAATASGTRVEGLTFYKGATDYNNNGGSQKTEGGGVYVASNTKAVIVDCAFVDCQATRGGGLYNDNTSDNVQAVRCLFKRCRDTKFGAAMRGGAAYFCVFDDCCVAQDANGAGVGDTGNAKAAFAYGAAAVNCTFVNNEGYGINANYDNSFPNGVQNCLFQNNSSGALYGVSKIQGTTAGNTGNIAYNTAQMEVFSPYDGDYRLTAAATAKTAGDATYAASDHVPAEFTGVDYNGNAFDTAAAVYAGAVQDALKEAASGVGFAATTDGVWTLDGEAVPLAHRTWRGTVGWPVPQKVGFLAADGRALLRFGIGGAVTWPLPDDTAWVHPSKTGIVQTMGALTTANVFYADPAQGSDDTGDGTAARPFQTLTKAIQYSTANHVVIARAGDYNSGSQTACGMATRVVVPRTLAGTVRVIAESGPSATFITGAAGTDDAAYATGADAVRCLAVLSTNAYLAAFQGFTIRNGHTQGANTSATGAATMGGALANFDTDNKNAAMDTGFLLDCVVENCTARRGAAVFGGKDLRCTFKTCRAANSGGGVFRGCTVVSSLIDACGGASELFTYAGSSAYNCTIVNASAGALNTSGGAARLYNCVAGRRQSGYSTLNASTGGGVIGTLYDTIDASATVGAGCAQENPILFADAALGDWRLTAGSAGATLATTAYLQSCMDRNGNPFAFDTANGVYPAGCYTPPQAGTVYYVDAERGSDANDGTDAAPFATLAAALAVAAYGDTVIALPGTYARGTAVPTLAQAGGAVTPTVAARVVVKTDVTLASRDGAAATIIQGAADPDTAGCGANAVRGVFLCKGATLRGFTVTGGYTGPDENSMTVNGVGGGVCGYYAGAVGSDDEYAELVEDCVITGNTASRGGGAMYGVYRNCVFTDNEALGRPGYALARAKAEGCSFAGNGPAAGHSVIYGVTLVNCTVRGGQAQGTGAVCNENSIYRSRAVYNSVILADRVKFVIGTNCVLGSSTVIAPSTDTKDGTVITYDILTNNVAIGHAALDANGVPLAGSAVIDAGDAAFCSADFLAGRDLAGTRRVLNSAIDIGAYEYDWGVPWGQALGDKTLVIEDMPSEASFADGRLSFADGTVEMIWGNRAGNAPYTFSVQVTGNGTLTVTVNGAAVGTYTAADGAQTVRFTSDLAANALAFAYTPGANDAGGADLFGFSHTAGLTILLR